MEKSRKRMIIAIVVNVLVFACEVYAMYRGIKKNGPFGNFIFYTECSNLFAGIVCAACAVAVAFASAACAVAAVSCSCSDDVAICKPFLVKKGPDYRPLLVLYSPRFFSGEP